MFVCKKKTWEIQKVYTNRKTLPIVLGNDGGGGGSCIIVVILYITDLAVLT